jgi:uncharacterized membrane protein
MATLQNKAQKVANNLDEVVIAKGVQHIQVQAGTVYQLNAKDFDTKKINLLLFLLYFVVLPFVFVFLFA